MEKGRHTDKSFSWNWRGDNKLSPISIFFFLLLFFLLGEQLLALPTSLAGPGLNGEGPDKLHILDLAPGDALHRPIFYFIFGTISWLLFRFLSWPLVWVSATIFWVVFKLLLPDPDQTAYTLIFSVVTVLIVIPGIIYRAIGRKWGERGQRNAILVLVIINLLLLSFFAYEIYGAHNSYRNYPASQGSLPQSGSVVGVGGTCNPLNNKVRIDNQTVLICAEQNGRLVWSNYKSA